MNYVLICINTLPIFSLGAYLIFGMQWVGAMNLWPVSKIKVS